MTPTVTAHILLDERGIPWIDDTNVKVIEVVVDRLAYGWSPEEMHSQHPNLSLAQIHAALSYYHDHQEEIDAQIERDLEAVDAARKAAGPSPFVERMRKEGKLP